MTHASRGSTMDCEEVVRALWDYLDGRCPAQRRALIEEHLALCASCRSHAEFERKLMAKLAETGRSGPDEAALRTRILKALREAAGGGERGVPD